MYVENGCANQLLARVKLMERHFRVRWRYGSLAWTPSGSELCRLGACTFPLLLRSEERETLVVWCARIPTSDPGKYKPPGEQRLKEKKGEEDDDLIIS